MYTVLQTVLLTPILVLAHIGAMNTNLKLKTREAAEVAGVGYEGFRSWLKRGLIKDTGLLAKFYSRDAPAEIVDAKRWQWSAFGYSDLCCFRLAKILFDAGLPWGVVNPIVSDNAVWQSHHHTAPMLRYIVVFDSGPQWTPYTAEEFAADLASGVLENCERMIVVDLRRLRQDVLERSNQLATTSASAN